MCVNWVVPSNWHKNFFTVKCNEKVKYVLTKEKITSSVNLIKYLYKCFIFRNKHTPLKSKLHCTEDHIFFFQMSWKDGLSKKVALKYDLSYIIEKDDISFFPENMILPFRQKVKDDLSQKNTRKYDIFFERSKNMFFSEKVALEHALLWAESERWPFSRNTWKYDIFCVHVRVLQTWRHAPLSRKSNMILTSKIHLKVIDVLDWYSRKSSSNSLYFHGDLCRGFHALQWKKPWKKIYRIEVWLILQLIQLRRF